jgi:hypothetical protein
MTDSPPSSHWREVHFCCHWTAVADGMQGTSYMIRKLKSGKYRLYSKKRNPQTDKRRNLGTFSTREAAERHEREIHFFKKSH